MSFLSPYLSPYPYPLSQQVKWMEVARQPECHLLLPFLKFSLSFPSPSSSPFSSCSHYLSPDPYPLSQQVNLMEVEIQHCRLFLTSFLP